MSYWDWDALRAYVSPVLLTVVAFLGIWKDSKDYKERAYEPGISRRNKFLRLHAPKALSAATIILLIIGVLDIHGTRKTAADDKASAQVEKTASDQQVKNLQAAVNTGNGLLTQQRQDFLTKFSEMSNRVADLQTQIKTTDLHDEAAQLRADLDATRKTMDPPKATLKFSFASTDGQASHSSLVTREGDTAKVRFFVLNDTEADALEGELIFEACDGCTIVAIPDFIKMSGSPENHRNLSFQHILAHTKSPVYEVTIKYPPEATAFLVGMEYRCRTCVRPVVGVPIPAAQVGTVVFLGGNLPRHTFKLDTTRDSQFKFHQ